MSEARVIHIELLTTGPPNSGPARRLAFKMRDREGFPSQNLPISLFCYMQSPAFVVNSTCPPRIEGSVFSGLIPNANRSA